MEKNKVPTKCEMSDCTLDCFESETKCILHCDKTLLNDWILSTKYTPPENYGKSNADPVFQWNQNKLDCFWNTFFEVIKTEIIERTKKPEGTTGKAVRIRKVSFLKKQKFYINFLMIKFPAINSKSIEKYIKWNNKNVIHNQFQNCHFYDNCVINTSDSKLDPFIDDRQTTKNRPIHFYNCTFEQSLIFYRPNCIEEKISIGDCQIEKAISLVSNFDDISISNTKANSLCIGEGDETSIQDYHVKNILFYHDNHIEKLCFKKSSIDSLIIDSMTNKIMKFHKVLFENSKFKKISMKNIETNLFLIDNIDILKDAKILFENIKTKVLKIKRLSQDSKYIQFHNITTLKKFECERVEFNNTYFNDFNIADADKKIEKTSFVGSHLNSIRWGNISKIEAKQDIFRQLKFVNDLQGNHIEANSFFANEMRQYKIKLKEKSWKKHFQEKLVFNLNEKISNFGQSYLRPIGWIIFFVVLYNLIILGYKENYLYQIYEPINPYIKNIADFFNNGIKTIKPLEKILKDGIEFISLVFYIIFSILIWQTVVALKRYTKR